VSVLLTRVETFGGAEHRESAFRSGVAELLRDAPAPDDLALTGEWSCGYPTWIVCSDGSIQAPDEQHRRTKGLGLGQRRWRQHAVMGRRRSAVPSAAFAPGYAATG
jgi:hypothetical protein